MKKSLNQSLAFSGIAYSRDAYTQFQNFEKKFFPKLFLQNFFPKIFFQHFFSKLKKIFFQNFKKIFFSKLQKNFFFQNFKKFFFFKTLENFFFQKFFPTFQKFFFNFFFKICFLRLYSRCSPVYRDKMDSMCLCYEKYDIQANIAFRLQHTKFSVLRLLLRLW